MNLESFWDEIENEQAWRVDEIDFFRDFLLGIDSQDDQYRYRRALVLILYAHFEGFCKFAFEHYIHALNDLQIKCNVASYSLVAATLANVFKALRNPSSKSDLFQKSLPDDSQLHLFARDCEFVEKIDNVYERDIEIPDNIIDRDSNLKPVILKKILFRLGLPHNQFDSIMGQVNDLVDNRNSIAHGQSKKGFSQVEYERFEESVIHIMNRVKNEIMDSLKNKKYLRIENEST